jgi:NAD(P)H-dependent flavin oxidoreductase YrpB (nitropropane dioxygenase family)
MALTKESPIHQKIKSLCFNATEVDTIYSDKFDGMYSRVLRTKNAEIISKGIGFINPLKTLKSALVIKEMLNMPLWKLMLNGLRGSSIRDLARQAASIVGLKRVIEDGDEERGFLVIGQVIGMIEREMTVKEVMDSMVVEAKEVLEEMRRKSFD